MRYYKLTKGTSGEIGVDRAAKNLDGKTLATTDLIPSLWILTGTFTTDEQGTPTFDPPDLDGNKIIAANDGDCTCFYDRTDDWIIRMESNGGFNVGINITNGVCYYIG